jgi:hypothetical protein
MGPAIESPTGFGGSGALRRFLAETDRHGGGGRNAELLQERDGLCGAAVAQRQIVLGRASFVAVTFDGDLEGRELGENGLQEFGITAKGGKGVGSGFRAIVGEEGVFELTIDFSDDGREGARDLRQLFRGGLRRRAIRGGMRRVDDPSGWRLVAARNRRRDIVTGGLGTNRRVAAAQHRHRGEEKNSAHASIEPEVRDGIDTQ